MRGVKIQDPRGRGEKAGHAAGTLRHTQEQDRLVSDPGRGGVENGNHLEGGLRRCHVRARKDRVVVETVREHVLSPDRAHAADQADLAPEENATSRINASQCSPVRGHDMSLAYA